MTREILLIKLLYDFLHARRSRNKRKCNFHFQRSHHETYAFTDTSHHTVSYCDCRHVFDR